MNCDDFLERLQHRLDHRQPIDQDQPLQHHATHCDLCRGQLFAWQQISQIMPTAMAEPIENRAPLLRRLALSATMIAAAVMFAFFVITSDSERSAVGSVSVRFDRIETAETLVARDSTVDASQWIRSVRERQWIDETMPTVYSFREGVAPIGRSLIRAVTILTTSSAEQPS